MESVILVIHLFLALAIIGLVLLQRSEGGGLGIGGGGLGGLATPQGTANLLTRATAICAAAFFCTSLILGVLAGAGSAPREGILEAVEAPAKADEDSGMGIAPPAPQEEPEGMRDAPGPAAPIAE